MARRRKGRYRVLGPYRHHNKWRIILVGPEGSREVATFDSEREAKKEAAAQRRQLPGQLTMENMLDIYEEYLEKKGNKASSVERTMRRLRLFHDQDVHVNDVTLAQLASRYAERQEQVSVDSHRNELNETKTFWRWCVRKRFVTRSPAEQIEAVGRRNRGKKQLRRAEAVRLYETAIGLANQGDEGALAVAAVLMMGLRSESELLCRKVRDLDLGEVVLLWIDDGKTAAARRHHEVPEPVAGLLERQAAGRGPGEFLFPGNTSTGHRRREWLSTACRRLCKKAGVPYVSPQGLRGTWATLASEACVSSRVVAREMGHADDWVTKRHYMAPGSEDRARTRKMLKVISSEARDAGTK